MSLLKRLIRDRRGNVTMMFGLAIIPLFGFVSLAVDYARASSERDKLHVKLDGAALALASLPGSVTPSEIETKLEAMLNSSPQSNQLPNPTFEVEADAMTVTISASGNMATSFAKVLGINEVQVAARVRAQRPRTAKADIALVLDNTGSMNSHGRLSSLKSAISAPGTGMTSALRTAFISRPTDVRVSVVPFSVGVRLPNVSASLASVITPVTATGWSGCVYDRPGAPDLTNVTPVTATPTTFLPRTKPRSPSNACPGTAVSGLTSDLNAVDASVNAMFANGNTNNPVGLFWGRQSLQPNGLIPGGAAASATNLTRYLVLLTDGDNTESHEFAPSAAASIDTKMRTMCTEIRNSGVIIYTIGLGTTMSANSITLLGDCAGHPDRAKRAVNSSDLNGIFQAIATDVAKTRLLN
jgi:Flp pilus assembly protein TadG